MMSTSTVTENVGGGTGCMATPRCVCMARRGNPPITQPEQARSPSTGDGGSDRESWRRRGRSTVAARGWELEGMV